MAKLQSSIFSCSHDNLLKSWSTSTGRLEATFIGSERAIYTIHLSPFNPSLLFSGGYDCAIRVWDIKSAQCTHTLKGHTDSIFSLLLLPDGRLISGSSDKSIKVWNLKTRKCEATLTGHLGGILAMVWVQALGVVVSASIDHTLKVWAMRDRDMKCEMTLIGHALPVSSLVVLDDNRVVSASHDKTLRVWNIHTSVASASTASTRKPKCELIVTAHTAPIQAIILLTPDRLVSCSRDLTIKLWNTSTFTAPLLVLQGHTKDINSLAVLPDGRLASASSDCSIRVWSLDLTANTGHCDLSFNNVGAEGRQFVVYGVSSYRGGEEGGMKRSASKGNLAGVTFAATPSAAPSVSNVPSPQLAPVPAASVATPTAIAPADASALTRSRGRSKLPPSSAGAGAAAPSASTSVNPSLPSGLKVDPASSASVEQRRLEKLKRARDLERQRQLEQAKMEDEGVVDEEEARRFSSVLHLKADAELPEGVRELISKYRNAHHLNYSDILNDGWFDDGGLIPGINAAKVGRERGGGRWEGDVILYDAQSDAALSDIVETAKKLVRQQDSVKGRVQILAQLVSNKLGGLPNDVVTAWERVMKKALRYRQQRMATMQGEAADVDQRIILPVGALLGEGGLTRHRACLFKYLCDLTVQNPEEWCGSSDEVPMSPGMEEEKEREVGEHPVRKGDSRDDLTGIRLSRFLDDSTPTPSNASTADEEKGHDEERERHRLGPLRRSSDSDVDKNDAPLLHHSPTPDELAIHCRLIRGQYQYYVPRSRKHRKDASGQPLSPSASPSPTAAGEDDDRGRERVGGYHAWNVVIIEGGHYVVDLIYQPSMLYHESSREAMHYNRGRFGSPKQTGLTNLPIRDVREIEWAELSQISSMKDGGFGEGGEGQVEGHRRGHQDAADGRLLRHQDVHRGGASAQHAEPPQHRAAHRRLQRKESHHHRIHQRRRRPPVDQGEEKHHRRIAQAAPRRTHSVRPGHAVPARL